MTRPLLEDPILDFEKAQQAGRLASDACEGEEWPHAYKPAFIASLEAQAQQAVAAEREKYAGKIYTKEDAEALCEVVRAALVQHYAPLVKAHREWVEARNAWLSSNGRYETGESDRYELTIDALAAIEPKEGL